MATLVERINLLAGAIRDKFNAVMPRLIPSDGVDGQLLSKNGSTPFATEWRNPAANTFVKIENEFISNSASAWTFGANSGGSANSVSASNLVAHPGMYMFRSSTTANSGYRALTANTAFALSGGEVSRFIFYVSPVAYATSQVVLGYTNSISSSAGNHEVVFVVSAGSVIGRCGINNVYTSSPVITTLTAGVYYKLKIAIADNGSSATFSVFDDAGALIAAQTVSTNLPTDGVYRVGHGVMATSSGVIAQDVAAFDYMSHEETKVNRSF